MNSQRKAQWTLFAAASAAALVCLLQPAAAGAQTVGPNINLTQAAGNQFEPAVAVDPRNSSNIFVAARNEIGGLSVARSTDGGATWTRRLMATSNTPAAGDVPRAYGNASVAWDSFGNLFLTYLAQGSPTAATYVALAVSTDGGATFHSPIGSGPAMILPNVSPYRPGDQPTVTVGPGSGGYAASVWLTYFTFGGVAVSGAGVSGLGQVATFATQTLPSQPAGMSFGDIAVGPNGEVVVTYGPDSGIWVGTSTNAVYTQTAPAGLGASPCSPCTPGFNNPVAAATVNIGGFTGIPAQPHWGVDPEAGLAFDRSSGAHRGRIYLVYTDASAVGSTDLNIFVVHSDDLGVTWSTPAKVNDDIGSSSQFLPRIAIDQGTGVVGVTWYDARNAAANDTAQYFGAFSTDGGATFSKNFAISQGTSNQASSTPGKLGAYQFGKVDFGDYTGSAMGGGKLIAAWADNSNSTGDNPDGATDFDLYAAAVTAPTPPVICPVTKYKTFTTVIGSTIEGVGPLTAFSRPAGGKPGSITVNGYVMFFKDTNAHAAFFNKLHTCVKVDFVANMDATGRYIISNVQVN